MYISPKSYFSFFILNCYICVFKSILKQNDTSNPESNLSATAPEPGFQLTVLELKLLTLLPSSLTLLSSLSLTSSPPSALLWNSGLAHDSTHVYICKPAWEEMEW